MRKLITISLLLLSVVAFAQPPSAIPVIPELLSTDEFYTRSRGRLYKVPADSILAYIERSGSFGGVEDGDKGDITVSSSGTVWNIDASVITDTEIAADAVGASELKNNSVGPNELAATSVTAGSYTNTSITVDADGRITSASNGSSGVSGTGTSNRVAMWNGASSLTTFPLQSDGSTTSFTQSTQVQLPKGSTGLRSLATDGDIRYNTSTERFEGYHDGDWLSLVPYVEESFTINFPSTSANATSSSTFAMLGADIGDAVVVGPPTAAAGQGTFFAYVSATNQITLRFHNDGSGTYDPGSGSFKIKVLK